MNIYMKQPLITFLIAIALSTNLVGQQPKKKEPPRPADIKALLITGGCCHDYYKQRDTIPEVIDASTKLKIDWTVVHQRSNQTDTKIPLYNNPSWATGYDIVVHNECFARISDNEYIKNIVKPHREGVPAVIIHCSLHSYRNAEAKKEWWELCGVLSRKHGPQQLIEVQVTKPDHEIMKGLSNWTTPAKGELYYILEEYPNAIPLAQAPSKETEEMHTTIWVNHFGENKTRVFGTSLGHGHENMLEKNYMAMLTKGFLWACGKPIEENFVDK